MFPILKRLKGIGEHASKEAAEMGCIEAAEELTKIAASITLQASDLSDGPARGKGSEVADISGSL
ncbi:hypothetical protein ES703_107750 [subsurface metagenome]